MKILITGGCGFVGSNLALKLDPEHEIHSLDNFSKSESKLNEGLLQKRDIPVVKGSISDKEFVDDLIKDLKPDCVIHLAAQVAMTDSIEDPQNDFNINFVGTFNLINAINNFSKQTKFINISTNKVYGDLVWDELEELETRFLSIQNNDGYDENTPLSFSGPYGCSKGSAEQYVLDYKKTFDLNTTSLRLSTIYGPNQYATFNQGWIGWFLQYINENKYKEIIEVPVHGNGKQVRDILFIDDFVELIILIINNFEQVNGEVFNIGGSLKNSLSIIELLQKSKNIFELNSEFEISEKEWRPADQRFYVSNVSKINKKLDWIPKTNLDIGLESFAGWLLKK
tara:strand:+ start:428 stop:1444 length:1017 start_codon:yes stop_codon:yes gene_type:complete